MSVEGALIAADFDRVEGLLTGWHLPTFGHVPYDTAPPRGVAAVRAALGLVLALADAYIIIVL